MLPMKAEGDMVRQISYPAIFNSADSGSIAAQKWYSLLSALRLLSLVSVAVVASAVTLIGNWVPIIAIIPISIAVTSEIILLTVRPDRRWYQCRTVAETAKSLAWRYQVGGRPFAQTECCSRDIDSVFISEIQRLVKRFGDSNLPPARNGQITADMRAIRSLPLEDRKSAYLSERIEDQMRWYANKADWNRKRGYVLQIGLLVVELGALGAAVWAISNESNLALYSVLSVIGIAIVGWAQIRQHGFLSSAYSIASHDLASISATIDSVDDDVSWGDYVGEVEDIISREHSVWVSARLERFSLG